MQRVCHVYFTGSLIWVDFPSINERRCSASFMAGERHIQNSLSILRLSYIQRQNYPIMRLFFLDEPKIFLAFFHMASLFDSGCASHWKIRMCVESIFFFYELLIKAGKSQKSRPHLGSPYLFWILKNAGKRHWRHHFQKAPFLTVHIKTKHICFQILPRSLYKLLFCPKLILKTLRNTNYFYF